MITFVFSGGSKISQTLKRTPTTKVREPTYYFFPQYCMKTKKIGQGACPLDSQMIVIMRTVHVNAILEGCTVSIESWFCRDTFELESLQVHYWLVIKVSSKLDRGAEYIYLVCRFQIIVLDLLVDSVQITSGRWADVTFAWPVTSKYHDMVTYIVVLYIRFQCYTFVVLLCHQWSSSDHNTGVCSFCLIFAKLCDTPDYLETVLDSFSGFYLEIAYSPLK